MGAPTVDYLSVSALKQHLKPKSFLLSSSRFAIGRLYRTRFHLVQMHLVPKQHVHAVLTDNLIYFGKRQVN